MIVDFREWRNVFVAHAEIQGEIAAQFPLVLDVGVPGIAAEVVVVGAELRRGLLRQAEQKIGEVVAGAWHLSASDDLGGVETGKDEAAARIAAGLVVELDAAEIATPAPGMFAVVPDHVVADGDGLVALQQRVHIVQTTEIGERQTRQGPNRTGFCETPLMPRFPVTSWEKA